jgi:succinylarginine dihydrolase
MRNGGGPACLRLRVPLTEREIAAAHPGVFFTPELHAQLTAWVIRHYRDRLSPADLADPNLLEESQRALDELSGILSLGAIYDFQR